MSGQRKRCRTSCEIATHWTPKKRRLHDKLLDDVTAGQRRVIIALIAGECAPTYREVAETLGLNVGSVYRHLKRIRDNRPDVYAAIMRERRRQLNERHIAAVERARMHSRRFFRRRANWRYYQLHGHWPWER